MLSTLKLLRGWENLVTLCMFQNKEIYFSGLLMKMYQA